MEIQFINFNNFYCYFIIKIFDFKFEIKNFYNEITVEIIKIYKLDFHFL